MEMKKAELIKYLFTNEEIVAINNKNRELEGENKKLKKNIERYEKEEDRLREENKTLKEKQKILDKENCELIDENVKLKKELEETNELLNNVARCSEQYREKMVSIMEELKMFLYKD